VLDISISGRIIRYVGLKVSKWGTVMLNAQLLWTIITNFISLPQQELLEKSQLLPRSINWHFIGALQTNKCRPLAEQIPNLWAVESVDTAKKADQLEKGRVNLEESDPSTKDSKVRVFVQVNTSGEEEKSGCEPGEETVSLAKHIMEKCPHLKLQGVMTIGAIARSQATSEDNPNEDFIALKAARAEVAKALGLQDDELELSMGMSSDYEGAIREGSSEVRVGTGIFGVRPAKKDAKVKDEVETETK
jgi:PLP dependent protein